MLFGVPKVQHIQGMANSLFRHIQAMAHSIILAESTVQQSQHSSTFNDLAWSRVWDIQQCDSLKGAAHSLAWHIHHSSRVNPLAQQTMWHSQHSGRINIPALPLRHHVPSLRHDWQRKKDVTTAIPTGGVSQSVDLGQSNNPNTTPTKDYEIVRVVVYLCSVQRGCAEEGGRGSTPTGC